MSISNCKILKIPVVHDLRGNLSVIENNSMLPFKMQRVYYLYDVPPESSRGGHAHKTLKQLIIAISGSFKIRIDDGHSSKIFHLNTPSEGLYICPYIWREVLNFTTNSICMVIASETYYEDDYIRNYKDFKLEVFGK